MPHIVIEYSKVLHEIASLVMYDVHHHVTQCGLFSPQAVKARTLVYEQELLPEGAQNFMHITISILSGRTEVERSELSAAVFKKIRDEYADVDRLSVDIAEMNKITYSK
jgi:5-carboxymethyl-2-hydroxymuconate isomerase